jgi:diguanylate cyclase (GGDEF)-like protein
LCCQEISTIFASYFGAALDNADMYQELRRRATRDPLTGLANRDLAIQRLDQSLASGFGPFIGLLFCDLDGFKSVNDRLGHDAGDDLLRQVAARFQNGLRPGDLIARFGGDEFVAVLGEIKSLDDVIDVGRRLVKALNEPFDLGEERVTASASIGGALGAPANRPPPKCSATRTPPCTRRNHAEPEASRSSTTQLRSSRFPDRYFTGPNRRRGRREAHPPTGYRTLQSFVIVASVVTLGWHRSGRGSGSSTSTVVLTR